MRRSRSEVEDVAQAPHPNQYHQPSNDQSKESTHATISTAHTVSATTDTVLKAPYFASLAAASSTPSSIADKDMFGLVFMPNGKQTVSRPKKPASWPLCRRIAGSGWLWRGLSA